jgi:hypothetical protein
MTMTLTLSCDGCHVKIETGRFTRKFISVSGWSHGFGSYHYDTVEDLVQPTGWMAMDPYTACTYCPKCWAEIESDADGNEKEVTL